MSKNKKHGRSRAATPVIPLKARHHESEKGVQAAADPRNSRKINKHYQEPFRQPDLASASFKGYVRSMMGDFWQGIIARQVFHKIITLVFALAVFGFAYMHMAPHRSVLTYMGVMLLMVLVYVEILVIRDHLWVIEGSMRESRKWRDVFFNQTNLRRQRIRKFLIMLFSLAIFSFFYIKSAGRTNPLLSFMGIILMITVLYYEILNIRDEVLIMMQSLGDENDKSAREHKSGHEKFIEIPHDHEMVSARKTKQSKHE